MIDVPPVPLIVPPVQLSVPVESVPVPFRIDVPLCEKFATVGEVLSVSVPPERERFALVNVVAPLRLVVPPEKSTSDPATEVSTVTEVPPMGPPLPKEMVAPSGWIVPVP